MNAILFLLFLSAAAVNAAGSKDLTATLSVYPQESLPGVPASFRVRVENHTSKDVVFEANVRLHVSRDGESFEAQNYDRDSAFLHTVPNMVTVPAHGFIEAGFPMDTSLRENDWFSDPRLCVPGDYSLRMTLNYEGPAPQQIARGRSAKKGTGHDGSLTQRIEVNTPGPSIDTNTASFRIIKPTGSDAEVWKLLQKTAENRPIRADGWSTQDWALGFDLAKQIFERYPDSNYVPYIVGMVPVTEKHDSKLPNMRYALQRFPDSPASEMLRLGIAYTLSLMSSIAAEQEGDVAKALQLREEAGALYGRVLAETHDPVSRDSAQKGLDHLPVREELEKYATYRPH